MSAKLASPLFSLAVGLLALTVAHAGIQALSQRAFSVGRTAAFAVLPVLAILIEKTLFVVEGPIHPAFRLYHDMQSSYFPSWLELSSIIGASP